MNDADRLLRQVFDMPEPARPEPPIEPGHPRYDPAAEGAVFLLVVIASWTAAYVTPEWGLRFAFGALAGYTLYGWLRRRLGWRWG